MKLFSLIVKEAKDELVEGVKYEIIDDLDEYEPLKNKKKPPKKSVRSKVASNSHMREAHDDAKEDLPSAPTNSRNGSKVRKFASKLRPIFVIIKCTFQEHKCDECGKTFSQASGLKYHIENVHEDIKKVECEYCGKSLKTHTLANHIRLVHEGVKPYKCDKCEKSFGKRINLRKHVEQVHEKLRNFHCEICGKAFGQVSRFILKILQNVIRRPNSMLFTDWTSQSPYEHTWSKQEKM